MREITAMAVRTPFTLAPRIMAELPVPIVGTFLDPWTRPEDGHA